MSEALTSQIVKGGGSVLFLDLRQAKNDTLYLTVTALTKNQEGLPERRSIRVFGEQITALRDGIVNIISSPEYAQHTVAA